MKPGKYEAMWLLNGCIVERVSAWVYSNMRAQGDQVGFSSEWGTDRVSHMEAPNLNDWKEILFLAITSLIMVRFSKFKIPVEAYCNGYQLISNWYWLERHLYMKKHTQKAHHLVAEISKLAFECCRKLTMKEKVIFYDIRYC